MIMHNTSNRIYYPVVFNAIADIDHSGSIHFGTSVIVDMDASDTHKIVIRVDGGSKTIDFGDTSRAGGYLVA